MNPSTENTHGLYKICSITIIEFASLLCDNHWEEFDTEIITFQAKFDMGYIIEFRTDMQTTDKYAKCDIIMEFYSSNVRTRL